MDLSLETAGEGKKNMYRVEIGRERGRMSRMQGKREVEREVRMTKFIHHLFNQQPLTVRMALDGNDQIQELLLEGRNCSSLMIGLTLMAQRSPLSRSDLLETLALQSSTQQNIEIYQLEQQETFPRL